MKTSVLAVAFVLLLRTVAQAADAPRDGDAFTRYELLAPGSARFRILYDVTAVEPGARAYLNPIRKGSVASDERVTDQATGAPLAFRIVSGAAARALGLADADPASDYIEVTLARPVPQGGGQGRIRIEKTYEDARSYRMEGADLVFDRPLGVKRNAVVLPAGYALSACNYPVQVAREADGRIRVSFLNDTPAEAPLVLRARPSRMAPGGAVLSDRLGERAAQTRDIVYFLKDPETHAFDLYHDYTEARPGMARYVNVVRAGSAASNPSARDLDTGAPLPATLLRGAAITAAGIADPDLPPITPATEIVVFPFPPLKAGQSLRLRMSETYVDPERYRLVGDTLVFDRTFGRPANAVVLPAGWTLTGSAAPATISQTEDGRTRLDFLNPRDDELGVLITARRESSGAGASPDR